MLPQAEEADQLAHARIILEWRMFRKSEEHRPCDLPSDRRAVEHEPSEGAASEPDHVGAGLGRGDEDGS